MFGESGRAAHERGVTTSPGLYFLGQLWQHARGSALLGWVKDDAAHIAEKVAAFRPDAATDGGGPTTSVGTSAAVAPASTPN